MESELTICLERLDAFRCFFRHVDDSTRVKDALLEFLTAYVILYCSCFHSITLYTLNLGSDMNECGAIDIIMAID